MIGKEPPVSSGQIQVPIINIDFIGNKDTRLKFLHALKTRAYRRNEIIPFSEIARVLSWYRIRKNTRDRLLYDLHKEGLLRVVPFRGIIIEGPVKQ